MASIKKYNDTYYAMYRKNGRQFKKKIGKVSKAVALKVLRDIEDNLALQKNGIMFPKSVKLIDFFETYLNHVATTQSFKTKEIKVLATKTFKKFLLSDRNYSNIQYLHELPQLAVEKYKSYRKEEQVSNRTINIELNWLSSALKMAQEWGYMYPEIKITRLTETKKLLRYLTTEEVEMLFKNASLFQKQFIFIGIHTGFRIGEMLNLEWKHIDFDENQIQVINTRTFNSKNKQDRSLPIKSELREYLLDLRTQYIHPNAIEKTKAKMKANAEAKKASTPAIEYKTFREPHQRKYVICHRDGSKIKSVRKSFNQLLETCNIKNASLHTLRHTFASHCVMDDIDIYTVKNFLGHSRITTTERYFHLSQEHQQKSIEKLSLQKNDLVLLNPAT